MALLINGSSKIHRDTKIQDQETLLQWTQSLRHWHIYFRQTQLLESHVSGHMVKKEITTEGEVRETRWRHQL